MRRMHAVTPLYTLPQRFECPSGSVLLEEPAPLLVLLTLRGKVDATVAKRTAIALQECLEGATAPVHFFWDAEALEQYHSDVRLLGTQVLIRNWSRVGTICVMTSSRIVNMGIAVANIALRGRIRSTGSRAEFEELMRVCR